MSDQAGSNRELFGVCAVSLFSFLSVAMTGLLVPLMALDLGAGPATVGLLIGVSNIGALALAVPAGVMVRRLGARKLLVAAFLIMGAGCLLIYLAPTITALFVGLSVYGLGRTVSAVAIQTHVGGIAGTKDASRNFGWYGTAVAMGQMVGPAIAGLAMDTVGKPATWLVIAALIWATAVVAARVITPEAAPERREDPRPAGIARAKELFDLRTIIGILSSFAIIFALGARTSFYPLFLRDLGFSASLIGAMISVRGFVAMLARMSIGPAVRLFRGRLATLALCLVVLAVGIGMTPLCTSVPLIVLNAVVIGIGFGVAMPLSQAVVFDGARVEDRGVAMGIRMTGNRLAQIASPLLFGFVIEWSTMTTAFWLGGLALFLSSVPLLVWWRRNHTVV